MDGPAPHPGRVCQLTELETGQRVDEFAMRYVELLASLGLMEVHAHGGAQRR